MNVAVLMGGRSFERDFSLASGKHVCEELQAIGHTVVPLDTTSDLVPTLRSESLDVCYSALHGKHGEDGTIQSLLELLQLPFVGSPSYVSRMSWNKSKLPSVLYNFREYSTLPQAASWPAGIALARDAFKDMGAATALDLIVERIPEGFPLCVKPACGGSAMGVHRVDSADELGEALLDALSYDAEVIIQKWIDGVELAVSLYDTEEGTVCLPPVEIATHDSLYTTYARLDSNAVTLHAPIRHSSLGDDEKVVSHALDTIEAAAREVYAAYHARDLARVDLIWDGQTAYVLEMDVSPGMSEHSLFPAACKAAGLTLGETLNGLIEHAVKRASA